MGLAVLYEIPNRPDLLSVWAFENAANHLDINRFILEKKGLVIPSYNLDPFDPADMEGWLNQHQAMHTAQNGILGISGFDLSSVDWNDEDALSAWIANHAVEHTQANMILGIP